MNTGKYFVFILFLLLSCNSKDFAIKNLNNDYIKYKNDYESKFIDQFPNKLVNFRTGLYSDTDRKRNIVGLTLYEYEAQPTDIDSLNKKMEKIAVAKYKSNDSCLLVVNRFETSKTYNEIISPNIDTLELNRDCEKEKYPIPNFLNYEFLNESNSTKLNENFIIYVIESKPGNHFKNFNLRPNSQMPKKWRNGYSKGIALSKKDKTIIYWSIIW